MSNERLMSVMLSVLKDYRDRLRATNRQKK